MSSLKAATLNGLYGNEPLAEIAQISGMSLPSGHYH